MPFNGVYFPNILKMFQELDIEIPQVD